ncbi:hypothetical protein [Streptomyces sp. NPDC058307]|uniref:hypothetical protein n=1 Tax=Streptomyces sp. NPDC058307 TaxID=3346439 RepID=UPI0036EE853F
MDPSVTGALIGLIGVVAGAGAAFGGVVYQQLHSERAALMARKRTEAAGAAEQLLVELLSIQQLLRRGTYDFSEEERREHYRTLMRHPATMQLHSQWLPDAELRSRLSVNALYVNLGPSGDVRSDVERRQNGMAVCFDSIACLGAFLRSEDLPGRPPDAQQVLDHWPDGQDGHTFIVSSWPADTEEPSARSGE